MGEAVADLVTLAIYGVVGVSVVGLVIWRVVKMQQAASTPISDEECVSCGSRQLTKLSAGTYRCDECGYEGGSGMAAAQAAEEWARIQALSPEERRQAGLRDLRSALDDLTGARQLLAGAEFGGPEVDSARRAILGAEESLRVAGLELGAQLLAPQPQGGQADHFAAATVADAMGGIVSMATSAADASSLGQRAVYLSQVAEGALAHYGQ